MTEIRLSDLTKTCDSCPAQWEGVAVDGRPVYVRYRWGGLTISIAEVGDDPVGGQTLASLDIGDGLDGVLSERQLQEAVNSRMSDLKIL